MPTPEQRAILNRPPVAFGAASCFQGDSGDKKPGRFPAIQYA